jgi:hypothetical protein
LTDADPTPGSLATDFSTAATQAAHLSPVISRLTFLSTLYTFILKADDLCRSPAPYDVSIHPYFDPRIAPRMQEAKRIL